MKTKPKKVATFFDIITRPLSYKLIIDLDLIFLTLSFLIIFLSFFVLHLVIFPNIWYAVFFSAFFLFVSFLIIKPDRFLRTNRNIFGLGEEKVKNKAEEKKQNRFIFKRMIGKFLVILPRITFFNILFYFFPVFIIYVALTIFFYILGYIKIPDISLFIQIATLISIILGFFQYYLNRHEEKIQQIIISKLTSITQVIVKEASFVNFKKFLEEKQENHQSQSKINEIIRVIKNAMKEPLYKLQDKRLPGKEIIHYQPQFIVGGGDEFLFHLFESEIQESEQEKYLIELYTEFFDKVKINSREKLKRDAAKIDEFAKLLFTNINIVGESRISFLQVIYDLEKYEIPCDYSEFLIKTNYELLNEVLTNILYGGIEK